MISTRRTVAAFGLAVGVTGLAAPTATAAGSEAHGAGKPNPVAALDSLATSGIPAEHRVGLPRPSAQLAGLNRLDDLNQPRQVTDPAAPVTELPPGIRG